MASIAKTVSTSYITFASERERAKKLEAATTYNLNKDFANRKYIAKADMAYPVFTNNSDDDSKPTGGAILREIRSSLKKIEHTDAWNKDRLRSKALDYAKKEKARLRNQQRGGQFVHTDRKGWNIVLDD